MARPYGRFENFPSPTVRPDFNQRHIPVSSPGEFPMQHNRGDSYAGLIVVIEFIYFKQRLKVMFSPSQQSTESLAHAGLANAIQTAVKKSARVVEEFA